MQTMNAPDQQVDEVIGRLGSIIRESQRRAASVLRDCIGEVEDGQTPNVHRYELALREHHMASFAAIARNKVTELAHMPDLVGIVERAADSYLLTHAPKRIGMVADATLAACRIVVLEVKRAVQP